MDQVPSRQVARWVDPAMYAATPVKQDEDGLIRPHVELLDMTMNPLRVMAAVCQMYKGDPVFSPDDVPKQLALDSLRDMLRTTLKAPLEWVRLSFIIEGVSRSFTHQQVRQRTAAFAQESMRFAVKEDASVEVVWPPEFQDLPEDHPVRIRWVEQIKRTAEDYDFYINNGIPAESARSGLLIGTATRLHYTTNLRDLLSHAGYRLCSQAQFEWKQVWAEMIRAILYYGPESQRWQQKAIADIFKPICYQTGKCEFMGSADRFCVIRDRVQAHHEAGEQPETWTDIHPLEALRYGAARHG